MNKQKIWRTWCISYWSNANVIEWNEKILFHTYGDSQCKVLSFVSLIVRTLCFHSRSLSTLKCNFHFVCMKNKTLYMESAGAIFIHSLRCIKKLNRLLRSLVRLFHASLLVNKTSHWQQLYVPISYVSNS